MPVLFAALLLVQPDPYGPAPAGYVERLAWRASRGATGADRAIERWLSRHPAAPAADRALLAHRLCIDYGVLIGGPRRAAACRLSADLSGDPEDRSDLAIAEALRAVPAMVAAGGAIVPLHANAFGSRSADVSAGGVVLPWIVDTGAEITTVPESTAARIGARRLGASVDLGTSTSARVKGEVAVVDALRIGGATVRHVPVLILPDDMLRLRKDAVVPGIIGLPVLAAFGRVAWFDGGARLALGAAASGPRAGGAPVYWHEDGLGLPFTAAAGTRGVQLDTGANATTLTSAGLALLSMAQAATAVERTVRRGGAGGFEDAKVRVLPRLRYRLAGAPLSAAKVAITAGGKDAGTLGSDILPLLDELLIDFRTMRVSAVARRSALTD